MSRQRRIAKRIEAATQKDEWEEALYRGIDDTFDNEAAYGALRDFYEESGDPRRDQIEAVREYRDLLKKYKQAPKKFTIPQRDQLNQLMLKAKDVLLKNPHWDLPVKTRLPNASWPGAELDLLAHEMMLHYNQDHLDLREYREKPFVGLYNLPQQYPLRDKQLFVNRFVSYLSTHLGKKQLTRAQIAEIINVLHQHPTLMRPELRHARTRNYRPLFEQILPYLQHLKLDQP